MRCLVGAFYRLVDTSKQVNNTPLKGNNMFQGDYN